MAQEILTAADVLVCLRQAAEVHGSQAQAARWLGITPAYFCQLLSGVRRIEGLGAGALGHLGLERRYVLRDEPDSLDAVRNHA